MPEVGPSPSRGDACVGRYYVLAAVVTMVAALLTVRLGMGFEFPIPWNDETAFISQAFEFSRTGSFFVYGLNSERVLMWMPPGYMLLLSGVFKVFGYSFELARWVSCCLYLGAFGVALGILRHLQFSGRWAIAAILLTLIAFLSPYSLAISNLARMEAMYTLVFLASLLAMLRGRYGLGLALVLLGALVHFNAVYLLLPYAALVAWKILRREDLLIAPGELLVLVLAMLALAGYGVFAIKHIGGFLEDMKFQFSFKLGSPVMDGPWGWMKFAGVLLVALVQLCLRRRFAEDVILTLHAAAFLALALNGHNMWYSFAFVFAFWLLLLSLLVTYISLGPRQGWRLATAMLAGLLLYPLGQYAWAKNTQFAPMWPRLELMGRHFLAQQELTKIKAWIAHLPPGTTVSFGYTGVEPFFFTDFARAGALWSISAHSMVQVFPARSNDYRVFCDSALFPPYLANFDWDGHPRRSQDSGCVIFAKGQ